MAGQDGTPLPKPTPRKKAKAKAKRKDAEKLKAFRDAVWAREQVRVFMAEGTGIARCQQCRHRVWIDSEPHGEVHHVIPRSLKSKADRYNPENGQLLCPTCHGKVTRHEVTV